jgi:cytochrome c oxidase subunit II
MIHIDLYEKWWMGLSLVVLIVFAAAIGVAGFVAGFQVPVPEARVNPNTVQQAGDFSQPGLKELVPGKYEAHIVAQASPWKFIPAEIRIPVGATVTFYVTSADVQHGFKIQDTNVNAMVLPGQVTKLTHTFTDVGEFPYACTEYCGLGHQNMFGKIVVEIK